MRAAFLKETSGNFADARQRGLRGKPLEMFLQNWNIIQINPEGSRNFRLLLVSGGGSHLVVVL